MKRPFAILLIMGLWGITSLISGQETVQKNYDFAEKQYKALLNHLPDKTCFPRTTDEDGSLECTRMNSWTEGFFPGILWNLYKHTNSEYWLKKAQKWTGQLEPLKDMKHHHDIGFLMYCSFGNGYQVTGNKEYVEILIQSAQSLISRFNEKVGCIESWNERESWDGQMWEYPVIIDNMMNLELLYFAYKETGDSIFKHVANSHAEQTARHHIRDDYSSYHVINYDEKTGNVLNKQTCQGYSDNSTWARGQAWGIYGFVMAYRETQRTDFLKVAKNMADFFIEHPNLPEDGIPHWDFNVNQEGYTPDWDYSPSQFAQIPRDASAAAITASAFLELSRYVSNGKKYFHFAEKQLKSLASAKYRAQTGENNHFLLKHSVGSIPHHTEVDVPLIYADYYFLEALNRYKKLSR